MPAAVAFKQAHPSVRIQLTLNDRISDLCASTDYLASRTPQDLSGNNCLGFAPSAYGGKPMHLVYPSDRRATLTLWRFIDFAVQRFSA